MIEEAPDNLKSQAAADTNQTSGWRGSLLRFRFLLNRFWWVISLCVVVGLVIQGCRLAFQPNRYYSVGRMILNGRITVPQGGSDVYSEDLVLFYGTQVALMKSGDTYSEAVERVRQLHPDMAVDESAILDASQVPKTSEFELSAISGDPEFARELVDAAMDTYLSSKRGRRERTTEEAISAITEEISKLDADTQRDQQQLLDFQKENNVVFVEEQSTNAAAYLVSLSNEIARLTKEYGLLKLESENPTANADGSQTGTTQEMAQGNASIAAQQENIEKLKILREQYSQVLKDKHPKMIALTEQIDKEQRFLDILKSRNDSDREAHKKDLELQLTNLRTQLDDWNKKALDLNQRLEIFQQLKGKIDREQNLYNQYATSIQHVDVSKNLEQDEVVIMNKGTTGTLIDPQWALNLTLGAGGGLFVGCCFIYLISRLDNRINSPLDFEDNFEVRIIGQVPRTALDKKTKRIPLLGENDKRHVLGESYRNIRSSILFSTSGQRPRSILISSAIPGEGKSTLSANLAVSFAFSGTKTLLIDGDLRRGVLHTIIPVPSPVGLTEYLNGELNWRDAVQTTEIPNLDILVRGRTPRNAGDLFIGEAMDLLLHESMSAYEMIIWDSAPILAADDAGNLCPKVDGVLFLVRIGYSTVDSVNQAIHEISQRHGRILGVVANGVQPIHPGYRNKYRYNEYSNSNITAD